MCFPSHVLVARLRFSVYISTFLAVIGSLCSFGIPNLGIAEDADDEAVHKLEKVFGEDAYVRRVEPGWIRIQVNERADGHFAALALQSAKVRELISEIGLKDSRLSKETFQTIASLSHLECLHLSGNEGWHHDFATILGGSQSLETLWIQEVGLDGSDLRGLCRAANLRHLMIGQNNITSGSFEPLGKLSKLELLDLADTGIKDEDLRVLRKLPELRHMHLDHTEISDRGVPDIASCKKLEIVSLVGTKVTITGVGQLRKALPNVIVSWGDSEKEEVDVEKSLKK